MKKKILITGIKGFLGRHLSSFLQPVYEIYGIGREDAHIDNIQVFSSKKLLDITIEPHFIILCHAAVASGNRSPTNDELYDVNVKLTKDILNLFPDTKIIYISTASIYKPKQTEISEDSEISPQSNYAISKLWAEQLVKKSQDSIIVRLSSLYGIGMKENTIIPNYIRQGLESKSIQVWGKGSRLQNYIFVNDVCKGIKAAILAFENIKNNTFLFTSVGEYSNKELANLIAQKTNSKIEFINEDKSNSFIYDNQFTRERLNWEPVHNINEELDNYIEWKKKQY